MAKTDNEEFASIHQSVGETCETTSTGKIFKNIGRRLKEEDLIDDDAEDQRQFAGIVQLGRREGWLVDAKDVHFQSKEFLGAGTFGAVVSAVLHVHAKELLVVTNELRILRHVRHPNIVLFFGACIDASSEEICLILDRIFGMHLGRYLKQLKDDADIYARWCLILDVACALRYLHALQPKIVHGDLKDGNIVVESCSHRAKLLDFGLARVLTKRVQSMGGSLKWMAPEVILVPKVRPRASADVFSFGRVAYMDSF